MIFTIYVTAATARFDMNGDGNISISDAIILQRLATEYAVEVKFGGYVKLVRDAATGRDRFIQEDCQAVRAIPYDLPVVGYGNNVVNTLRIWDAEAINNFNLDSFDKGDYQKAVEQENLARTICEVLYPNDNHMAGKELRLKQQYFFVSASIQRAIEQYLEQNPAPDKETNQMAWVQHMNSLKAQAEEILLAELINS